MRIKSFLNSPHLQLFALLCALIAPVLVVAGCGGGGGGGGNGHPSGCTGVTTPPGNPALATITGTVIDTANNPVTNAGVTVIVPGGANLTKTTDCTGKFVITNVPLTATSFMVSSPNVVAYYNYANYNGHLYDLVDCSLPLPKLVAGANAPIYRDPDVSGRGQSAPTTACIRLPGVAG